jgi:transposase
MSKWNPKEPCKPTEQEYEQGKADIKELEEQVKDGEIDLAFFDEARFDLTPVVPYAWQDIGREGTIGIPASHSEHVNVLGFLDPENNKLTTYEHKETVNSDVIIEIMDNFSETITKATVVVLDNASVHTSKKVSEKRKEWEDRGLTLHFLPPYSPHLNKIETLWRKVRYEWIPNWAYAGITSMKIALRKIFGSFGSNYKIQFAN